MIRALIAVATILSFAVAGCGQKGPLKIPEPAAAKPEPGKPGAGKSTPAAP